MGRPRVFWFHYSRPGTLRAGDVRWSVHCAGTCHLVSRIDCRVPVSSKTNARQPRAVMRGVCRSIKVIDGVAVIE